MNRQNIVPAVGLALCSLVFILNISASQPCAASKEWKILNASDAHPQPRVTIIPLPVHSAEPTAEISRAVQKDDGAMNTYVFNKKSGVVHRLTCQYADQISETNRREITCTRDELLARGWNLCDYCKP